MSQTSPVTESAPLAWRYEIQHGPDGETDYAWVYDLGNNLVCTTKTRHAIAIVDAMRGHAKTPNAIRFMEVVRSRWNFEDGEFDAIEKVISDPDCMAALADTSTDRSPVMQAADKAAKVVEGWSDAKREYAGRVTDSSPDRNSK